MNDIHTISIIVYQIRLLQDFYDCDIYNITQIRELSYRECYEELYELVSTSSDKYHSIISNNLIIS